MQEYVCLYMNGLCTDEQTKKQFLIDPYSAAISRPALLCSRTPDPCAALSTPAMSTLAIWCRVVQSRVVRSRDFSVPRESYCTFIPLPLFCRVDVVKIGADACRCGRCGN